MSIDQIIIDQITKYLSEKGENLDDFRFVDDDWKIIIIKGEEKLKLDYKKQKISDLVKPSKSWIQKLQTTISPLLTVRWIVKLNKKYTINQLERHNMVITHVYNHVYKGAACVGTAETFSKLPPKTVKLYKDDITVEITAIRDSLKIKDEIRATNLSQIVGGFIGRIGANHSSKQVGTKKPIVPVDPTINVFIVDTGIDKSHTELNINTIFCRNFSSSDPNDWNDTNGHGTHVAGIIGAKDNNQGIAGVTPGVNLVAIRVLGASGMGSTSNIVAALDYIVKIKKSNPLMKVIVNMSLGGSPNSILDSAVKNVVVNGIPVVVAAGNSGTNATNSSPARVAEAITVGAYDSSNNKLASWSNFGSQVDILAPGVSIDSTFPINKYAVYSGTSMAAPIVTGTIACLMTTNPTMSPGSITAKLISDAQQIKIVNNDGTIGNNAKITLTPTQINAKTPNISIYDGKY